MKKRIALVLRIVRMSIGLILCLSMLMSDALMLVNGVSSLAENSLPLAEGDGAKGGDDSQTETYYSPKIDSGDLLENGEGSESTGTTGVSTYSLISPMSDTETEVLLSKYVSDMSVTLVYQNSEVQDGDTLTRNAAVRVTLNFRLLGTMQENTYGKNYIFTYKVPSSITIPNTTAWTAYYDGYGVHLMDWICVDNTIKIRFTTDFYTTIRNNIRGYVTVQGVLNSSYIVNGEVTYDFPQGSLTVLFPPAVGVSKNLLTSAVVDGDDLVWTYYVAVQATDNLTKIEFSDVRGENIDKPLESDRVIGGGTGSTPASSGHSTIPHQALDGDTFFIEGSFAKNTYYFLIYSIRIPVSEALTGILEETVPVAKRTNTATVTITDAKGASATGSASRSISWVSGDIVYLTKTLNSPVPDENGQVSFTITVTPRFTMDSLLIEDIADEAFQNGKLYLVNEDGSHSDPYVSYTFDQVEPGKTYTFLYIADFPYEAAANKQLTDFKYNTATATWRRGDYSGTNTATAYMPDVIGSFSSPKKALNKVDSENLWVDVNGNYFANFTVTIPAANLYVRGNASNPIFKDVYMTDTMGAYLSLVEGSILINNEPIDSSWLEIDSDNNSFTLKLGESFAKDTHIVSYTAQVDKTAVEQGLLNSSLTDNEFVEGRTNTVNLEWRAPGAEGTISGPSYELNYDKNFGAATIAKEYAGSATEAKYNSDAGYYEADFQLQLSLNSEMKKIVIQDLPGGVFDQTGYEDWGDTVSVKRVQESVETDYTEEVNVTGYGQLEFESLPAGNYVISYTIRYANGLNGLSYAQVVRDENTRTNTVVMTYTNLSDETSVATAYAVAPALSVGIEKKGTVQMDGSKLATTEINGATYAMVEWEITVSGDVGMLEKEGDITDTLFGRQCFAKNDDSLASLSSFLQGRTSSSGDYAYYTPYDTEENFVGTEEYLQEFAVKVSAADTGIITLKYLSYVRLPNVQQTLTVSNQAVYTHPTWGAFTATATEEIEWDGGTGGGTGIAPVKIEKELLDVYADGNDSFVSAVWQIVIPASSDKVIQSGAILTDFLSFHTPESYFTEEDLALSVKYANSETGPSYTFKIDESNRNRLFITFTEDLSQKVVITLASLHGNVDYMDDSRLFINNADLEYNLRGYAYTYYAADSASWSMGQSELTKAAGVPRLDKSINQYVIDWTVTLEDSLRSNVATRIRDDLPEGLSLISGSVRVNGQAPQQVESLNDSQFVVYFIPTSAPSVITFTTIIDESILDKAQVFENRANLLVRDLSSEQWVTYATAKAEIAAMRSLSKQGSLSYNYLTGKYEILWTIQFKDAARKDLAYLHEIIPAGLQYVEGSLTTSPARPATVDKDGQDLLITLGQSSSESVTLQFVTVVENEELLSTNHNFLNVVNLLGSKSDYSDIILTAKAYCSITGGVRNFTKDGLAYYDEDEKEFLLDWTIVLEEELRKNTPVTLKETFPSTQLTLGRITVVDGATGAEIPFTPSEMAADGTFTLQFTPTSGTTIITIRSHFIGTNTSGTFINKVALMAGEGEDQRELEEIETQYTVGATGSIDKVASGLMYYDSDTGRFYQAWTVIVTAPQHVGREIRVNDFLNENDPAKYYLRFADENPVICTDAIQPLKLKHEIISTSPTGDPYYRESMNIDFTPSQAVTTFRVLTEVHYIAAVESTSSTWVYNFVYLYEKDAAGDYVAFGNPNYKPAMTQVYSSFTGDRKPLRKGYNKTEGSDIISFTIYVNNVDATNTPYDIDIAYGASELTVSDILPAAVDFLPDTLKVIDKRTSKSLGADEYSFQYNPETRELLVTVPNRRPITITFDTILNGAPGEAFEFVNTATFTHETRTTASTNTISGTVSGSAGLESTVNYVKVTKFNASNWAQKLQGVQFAVYKADDDAQPVPAQDGDTTATGLTDSSGVVCLPGQGGGLRVNTLYYVQEVQGLDGYKTDATKHYFVILGEEDEEEPGEGTGEETGEEEALDLVQLRKDYPGIEIAGTVQFHIGNWPELTNRVVIRKNSTGRNQQAVGATLEIREGTVTGRLIASFTTTALVKTLENLDMVVGQKYWLVETTAADLHWLAEPVPFELKEKEITENGITARIGYAEVDMDDDPIYVEFLKTDKYGNALEGIKINVKNLTTSTGGVDNYETYTTTSEPILLPVSGYNQAYMLYELTTPTWTRNDRTAIFFEIRKVDDQPVLYTYTYKNFVGMGKSDPAKSSYTAAAGLSFELVNYPLVEIVKKDENGKNLAGAVLQLYEGTEVDASKLLIQWTSTDQPFMVPFQLGSGGEKTYLIHEVSAPEGYTLAEDHTFTYRYTVQAPWETPTKTVTVPFANVPETPENSIDITLAKVWADGEDQDGLRPDTITVKLTGSSVNDANYVSETVTFGPGAGGNWSYKWEGLPGLDTAGKTVSYVLEELNVPAGYTATVTGDAAKGFTLINTHDPETTQIKITKVWDDMDNNAGYRPSSIKLQVIGRVDGQQVLLWNRTFSDTLTSNTWELVWDGLPKYDALSKKEIVYTLVEQDVEEHYASTVTGNAASGFVVTNAHTPVRDITVLKSWKYSLADASVLPDFLSMTIQASLKARVAGSSIILSGVTAQVPLSKDNHWTHTWEGLPVFQPGTANEIDYSVEEFTSVDRFNKSVTGVINGKITLTNTFAPEKINITVSKKWRGDQLDMSGRTDIILKLTATVGTGDAAQEAGDFSRTVTLEKADFERQDTWSYTWSNLYTKDRDGNLITYTVDEVDESGEPVDVPGYYKTFDDATYTVINTLIPENIDVTVKKKWALADPKDAAMEPTHPSVKVTLTAAVGERAISLERDDLLQTLEANETDATRNWAYTWTGLPKYEPGTENLITYSAVETLVPDQYIPTVEDIDANGVIIVTNTFNPDMTKAAVFKVWADDEGFEDERPDIWVKLVATGPSGVIESLCDYQKLTAANVKDGDPNSDTWEYQWKNLYERSPDGGYIIYTVEEVDGDGGQPGVPSGYTSVLDGATIINTRIPETVDVRVNKNWLVDVADAAFEPTRPEVQVTLAAKTAAGAAVPLEREDLQQTLKANETDATKHWTYTWTGLPKYVPGTKTEIVYFVTEVSLADYRSDVDDIASGVINVNNTFIPTTADITVKKVWANDADDSDIRPSVRVKLVATVGTAVVEEYCKYVTLTAANLSETEADTWTYTWEDLHTLTRDKLEIVYSAQEVDDAGSPTQPEEYYKTLDGLTITNTKINRISIPVNKNWVPHEDIDASTYDFPPVTVYLYRNGSLAEDVAPMVLPLEGVWGSRFEDLPERDSNGVLYSYTIKEDPVENFTSNTRDEFPKTGYVIDNTYTPGKTSVSVTKQWLADEADRFVEPEHPPISVTLKATLDDEPYPLVRDENDLTVELSGTRWTYRWDGLPILDEDTEKAIVYTVEEDTSLADYTKDKTDDGKGNHTLINTFIPRKDVRYTVTKTWAEDTDVAHKRPEIRVKLIATVNGTVVEALCQYMTLTSAHETSAGADIWAYEWTGLYEKYKGQPIVYSVDEVNLAGESTTPSGYKKSVNGNVITNSLVQLTDITVTKRWVNTDPLDALVEPDRPALLVQLRAKIDDEYVDLLEDLGYTQAIETTLKPDTDPAKNLTYTFEGLPMVHPESGEPVVYSAEERTKLIDYQKTQEVDEDGNITLVNTYLPHKTTKLITKSWMNDEGFEDERPSIWVRLTATSTVDGAMPELTQYVQLTAAHVSNTDENIWEYEWTNLYQYDKHGQEIVYTAEEVNGDGGDPYTPTGYRKATDGLMIVNTRTDTTSVTAVKDWKRADEEDVLLDLVEPEHPAITVTLTATVNSEAVDIAQDLGYTGSLQGTLQADNDQEKAWRYTWDDLPVFMPGTEDAIVYSVTEDTPLEGYTIQIEDIANGIITVTNTYNPTKINKIATKVWVGDGAVASLRPSIWVRLVAMDPLSAILEDFCQTVELTAANAVEPGASTWTYTFTGLYQKTKDGKAITYTVDEVVSATDSTSKPPEGYDMEVNGLTITNIYKVPDKTRITVEKKWALADETDALLALAEPDPVPVSVELKATTINGAVDLEAELGITDAIVPLSETDNEWKYAWNGLPKAMPGTEATITYTVAELTQLDDYDQSMESDGNGNYTLTNSFNPAKTEVTVTKVWVGDADALSLRPSIWVKLIARDADGADLPDFCQTVELTAANAVEPGGNTWAYTFEGLYQKTRDGKAIVYTVDEVSEAEGNPAVLTGYYKTLDPDGRTITNTLIEYIDIPVEKIWVGNPGDVSAEFDLWRGGECLTVDDPLVLTATEEGRKGSFDHWPKADAQGNEYTYTVKERTINDYTTTFDGNQYIGFTFTNTYTPGFTNITVTKRWADGNDQDGIRPDDIWVKLTRTPAVPEDAQEAWSQPVQILADGQADQSRWSYTWPGLPTKDSQDTAYVYEVEEVADQNGTPLTPGENGYTQSYGATKLDLVNTHEPEKITYRIEKDWQDDDNGYLSRPAEIIVRVWADAAQKGTLELHAGNDWKDTLTLDQYADGVEITYTVTEDPVDGYNLVEPIAKIAVPGEDNTFAITLTNTVKRGGLVVKKLASVLADGVEYKSDRPVEGAVFELLTRSGQPMVPPVILTTGEDGTVSQTELPVGEYLLREITAPAGYDKAADVEILIQENKNNTYEVYDPATVIVLYKTDGTKPLKDAVLGIYATEHATEPLLTVTTGEDTVFEAPEGQSAIYTGYTSYGEGYIVLEGVLARGVTYYIKEITAPEGYRKGAWTLEVGTTERTLQQMTLTDVLIEQIPITVNKQWLGVPAGTTITPEPVAQFDLYRGSEWLTEHDPLELRLGETLGTFGYWPKTDPDGVEYVYTVQERELPGFSSTHAWDAVTGYTFFNEYTPTKKNVTAIKWWEDANNQDGIRPPEIYLQLTRRFADEGVGTAYRDAVPVLASQHENPSNANQWRYTWPDVEIADEVTGKEYIYEVMEVDEHGAPGAPEGYAQSYSADKLQVTNTHAPEQLTLTLRKDWEDENNGYLARPTRILVTIKIGSQIVREEELNADNEWEKTITLDRYADGLEITYTFGEEKVDRYTSGVGELSEPIGENNECEITITNTIISEDLEILKYASVIVGGVEYKPNTRPLENAEFELLTGSGASLTPPLTMNTDANGKAILTKVLEGEYLLQETKAPAGYQKSGDIEVKVPEDDGPILVYDPATVVVLHKTNGTEPLAGATFAIYASASDANPVITVTTAEETVIRTPGDVQPLYSGYRELYGKGYVVLEGVLEAGKSYYVKELSPPKGYYAAKPFTLDVSEDGQNQIIEIVDQPIRVEVSKLKENGAMLYGATMALYAGASASGTPLEDWITSETDSHLINPKLLEEGKTYTLRELSPPAGYFCVEDYTFTVTADWDDDIIKAILIERRDPLTRVAIYKYDEQTGKLLKGATLTLTDKTTGREVDRWVSAEAAHILEGELIAGRTYILKEITAPTGFVVAGSKEFTVPLRPTSATQGLSQVNGNWVYSVSLYDQRIYQFSKVDDSTGNALAGATLYIRDAGGKIIVSSWVSTTAPHEVKGTLVPGQTYYLVEQSAPSGYTKAGDVEFKVGSDGTLGLVVMRNVRTSSTETPVPTTPPPGGGTTTSTPVPTVTTTPTVVATVFATATPARGGTTIAANRTPLGVRFVDGNWVYLDEYDTPLGVVPLTGDDSNWLLWIAAALIPVAGIAVAGVELRRRKKKAPGPRKAS